MKNEKQVKKKMLQVKQTYLKKKIKEEYRCPENCHYNYLHENEDGTVRLCLYGADNPEEWPGTICTTQDKASDCPFFEPIKSKDELKDEFESDLEDPTTVAHRYQDIAALQWVTGTPVLEWTPSLWQRFVAFVNLWAYMILSRLGVFG